MVLGINAMIDVVALVPVRLWIIGGLCRNLRQASEKPTSA
jgi:hypothetical protein